MGYQMHADVLNVELAERSYPIHIGAGLLANPELLCRHLDSGAVVLLSNVTVAPLYLDRVRAALGGRLSLVKVLPDGETYKNLEVVSTIYDALLSAGCDRNTTLVALGGGVVGDMCGFAAATYQRGVSFIQLPTTLLAQVDSSVGGKTGVNHARGKNMIGAFHQPRCVIADTDTLHTLPSREFSAGLAEVVKYGLIGDASFYRWLQARGEQLLGREPDTLRELVYRSCQNKARVVAADERESGQRALLNFGHTFGHAIETGTGYDRYLHGEAVAIGMLLAAELSHRLGMLESSEVAGIRALLLALRLPVDTPTDLSAARLLELMQADKKVAAGRIRLVLLRALGDAVLSADYSQEQLLALLQEQQRASAALAG